LLVAELSEGRDDRRDRALHVGLDDDRDLLLLAGLDAGEHLVERAAAGAGGERRLLARPALAVLADLARARLDRHDDTVLARGGHAREAEDLDRQRGRRLLDLAPAVV